jgi:hypothetical protein
MPTRAIRIITTITPDSQDKDLGVFRTDVELEGYAREKTGQLDDEDSFNWTLSNTLWDLCKGIASILRQLAPPDREAALAGEYIPRNVLLELEKLTVRRDKLN